VEAGFIAVLVSAAVALSIGLALGVLHVTMRAISGSDVPATPGAEITAAAVAPHSSRSVLERQSGTLRVASRPA
jgi:hypothetical protein